MTLEIGPDWKPTADNINALPEPLRVYVMKLVTHMDPAFTLQQLAAAQDRVAELEAALALRKAFGR